MRRWASPRRRPGRPRAAPAGAWRRRAGSAAARRPARRPSARPPAAGRGCAVRVGSARTSKCGHAIATTRTLPDRLYHAEHCSIARRRARRHPVRVTSARVERGKCRAENSKTASRRGMWTTRRPRSAAAMARSATSSGLSGAQHLPDPRDALARAGVVVEVGRVDLGRDDQRDLDPGAAQVLAQVLG